MRELRQAAPSEAAIIRDFTRAAYAKWVPVLGREPGPMGADYEAAVLKHRFDLLSIDGALAGLIETLLESDALLIVNVAIAPAMQGRGLGKMLLGHAEALARDAGQARLRLYTNKMMAENIALYARLGYAVTSEEDMGGNTVRVNMCKELAPQERL